MEGFSRKVGRARKSLARGKEKVIWGQDIWGGGEEAGVFITQIAS